MRLISSNVGSPIEHIAKWLVKRRNSFERPKNFSCKNSIDLVKSIEGLELNDDEVLVSFDVTVLSASIPVDEALEQFEDWIGKQSISPQEKTALADIMYTCMKQNVFEFKDKFYK